MDRNYGVIFLLAAGTATFAMGAQQKKIEKSQVPEAVLKAVEARYPGATLREFESESEDGKLLYEIALDSTRGHLEVVVSSQGRILEEEQSLRIEDVPGAVRKGLASSKYASAKVVRVERVSESGKATTFEIVVDHEGVEHQLVFSESGELQKDEKRGREQPPLAPAGNR